MGTKYRVNVRARCEALVLVTCLHDLRHQAATGMAECGVPLDIRQLVQNQITGRRQSIGARYDQHDYAAEKRRALELWERRLLTIIEGRPRPTERY